MTGDSDSITRRMQTAAAQEAALRGVCAHVWAPAPRGLVFEFDVTLTPRSGYCGLLSWATHHTRLLRRKCRSHLSVWDSIPSPSSRTASETSATLAKSAHDD